MSNFKPYESPKLENYKISKEELYLIQKLRNVGYGNIKVHVVNHKIIRIEISTSELLTDVL